MSDWRAHSDDPDEELKEADLLLRKADALLHRHKVPDHAEPASGNEGDDIPILTDVVAEFAQASAPLQSPSEHTAESVELAELLVSLDTELAREVETWFANELPQLVTRELDRLADRLRVEALAHMRATLIPVLSEHISNRLGRARGKKL